MEQNVVQRCTRMYMVLQEQSLAFIRAYYYACYCSFNTSSHYFLDSMHARLIHSRFDSQHSKHQHKTDSSTKIMFISNVLQAILLADDECRTVERTPPGNQLQPIPTQEQINSLSPSSYFQEKTLFSAQTMLRVFDKSIDSMTVSNLKKRPLKKRPIACVQGSSSSSSSSLQHQPCKSQRTRVVDNEYDSPDDLLRSFFPQDKQKTCCAPLIFNPLKVYDTNGYDMETVSAIRRNDVEKLRDMYENEGKNMNACNRNGETLLHLACRSCTIETVKFLVNEALVDVDGAKDGMGRTVLHDLLWRPTPNFDMLLVLLTSKRMSPELLLSQDARGHTPFKYARKEHLNEWVIFLRENRGLIEQRLTQ